MADGYKHLDEVEVQQVLIDNLRQAREENAELRQRLFALEYQAERLAVAAAVAVQVSNVDVTDMAHELELAREWAAAWKRAAKTRRFRFRVLKGMYSAIVDDLLRCKRSSIAWKAAAHKWRHIAGLREIVNRRLEAVNQKRRARLG